VSCGRAAAAGCRRRTAVAGRPPVSVHRCRQGLDPAETELGQYRGSFRQRRAGRASSRDAASPAAKRYRHVGQCALTRTDLHVVHQVRLEQVLGHFLHVQGTPSSCDQLLQHVGRSGLPAIPATRRMSCGDRRVSGSSAGPAVGQAHEVGPAGHHHQNRRVPDSTDAERQHVQRGRVGPCRSSKITSIGCSTASVSSQWPELQRLALRSSRLMRFREACGQRNRQQRGEQEQVDVVPRRHPRAAARGVPTDARRSSGRLQCPAELVDHGNSGC